MQNIDLEKSAENNKSDSTPKEVLNPFQTAKRYTFRIYPPSTALMPFVDYYWIMRWDLTGQAPFVAEVIPSPYTNLTFMPEGARITGVTTGKFTYELQGVGVIVGVKFKPGGLYTFWKQSLQILTDTHIKASILFPKVDTAYNDMMLRVADGKAVENIEKLLRKHQPQVDKNFELVTRTLDCLESMEHPSIADAIQCTKLSERRLQEIFRDYVGVGVKWIISRARLIKAAELAATLDSPNWAAIAHELGYTDQPHFINDFKRVIGKSPAQYAIEIRQR